MHSVCFIFVLDVLMKGNSAGEAHLTLFVPTIQDLQPALFSPQRLFSLAIVL